MGQSADSANWQFDVPPIGISQPPRLADLDAERRSPKRSIDASTQRQLGPPTPWRPELLEDETRRMSVEIASRWRGSTHGRRSWWAAAAVIALAVAVVGFVLARSGTTAEPTMPTPAQVALVYADPSGVEPVPGQRDHLPRVSGQSGPGAAGGRQQPADLAGRPLGRIRRRTAEPSGRAAPDLVSRRRAQAGGDLRHAACVVVELAPAGRTANAWRRGDRRHAVVAHAIDPLARVQPRASRSRPTGRRSCFSTQRERAPTSTPSRSTGARSTASPHGGRSELPALGARRDRL